jgi:hypothetical protein
MQKSHPSDEPRRDSAKALILHMGDVEEIDASYVMMCHTWSQLTLVERCRSSRN